MDTGMMGKKRKLWLIGILFLLVVIASALLIGRRIFGEKSKNLALRKGVKATCDSVETEELSAKKAIDGDDETLSSRWSSENNWEDAFHYIELEFPEEISVSFVVLKWERTNVVSYQLEGSMDGENWQVLEAFHQPPAARKQEIPLAEAVTVKFLRLSTNAVSQTEEDYSNLYQNVSLYEFEVYQDKPAAYLLDKPELETGADGRRTLQIPEAPEGYRITYLGADYEQIIGADREVYETIQDKEVTVGFLVEQIEGKEDAQEVSFTIQVPAARDELRGKNEAPAVVPAIAEWDGADGAFLPGENSRILVQQVSLWQTAVLFAGRYDEIMGYDIPVIEGTKEDVRPGDFYLGYDASGMAEGVGEEGYVCDISDKCVINGTHERGIYWGTITVLQMLKGKEAGILQKIPQGRIRDYPKYQVRGFGIDVARKPVSMAMLYQIVENMSWYKMNDLSIHLNDNVILSTSGLTDSIEEVMTAYSAFRIDTSVTNEKGERLTSADYAYTAEEFAKLIETARSYGVQIVPEIDTPAHSLSITKLFPAYALDVQNEAVDQIDLSSRQAVALVKDIWREVLSGGQNTARQAAFNGAAVVNIGMDEYYGDGETYRKYMNEMIAFVQEESEVEAVRLWGSLNNMEGTTMPPAEHLQMNVWSTIWADPVAMYDAGYSIINMQNNHLYIIPGGGYDYLDTEELYANWEPNKFYDYNRLESIPPYSSQMLGAAYMIWNDMSGKLDLGISESDIFDRFFQPLGVLSGKLWGEVDNTTFSYDEWQNLFEGLGYAPGSNPYAEMEWEENTLQLLEDSETVSLKGQTDYVETGYTGGNGNGICVGGDYSISMQVYREAVCENSVNRSSHDSEDTVSVANQEDSPNLSDWKEEILFETDGAYGQIAFKAVQKGTGQVGFSREGRDYSFAYSLPAGEWVTLTIRGKQNETSLYVNGELVDTLGSVEPFEEYATFLFPLERIGSQTNSFCGMIKDVKVQKG